MYIYIYICIGSLPPYRGKKMIMAQVLAVLFFAFLFFLLLFIQWPFQRRSLATMPWIYLTTSYVHCGDPEPDAGVLHGPPIM